MDRKDIIDYLRMASYTVTERDAIMAMRIIHYKHNKLISMDEINKAFTNRSRTGQLLDLIMNMRDFIMREFGIICVHDKNNNIINYA